MEKRLFLLDAYALIYRAYYAFIRTPRINSKGMNTSAIFGFVNTLEDLLKNGKPTHIAVVFDPKGGTFRDELFAAYKAHREETPEDIKIAIPYIQKIVAAYNIPSITIPGFEADDVIGAMATQYGAEDFTVYMMTPDKDYGQLVTDNVFIWKPARSGGEREILGVSDICAKYGIENPRQVIDILGLMGDAADNIPGCPGVGEKTAIKFIAQFGSIENLYDNIDSVTGKIRESLIQHKEQVLLSKLLATIKIDIDPQWNEEMLIYTTPNQEQINILFDELEFRNLKARVLGTEPTAAKPAAKAPEMASLFDFDNAETFEANSNIESLSTIFTTEHQYFLVDNDDKLSELIDKLQNSESFCFDTETTGIDPLTAHLVGISFSVKAHEAYYVPIPENRSEAEKIVRQFAHVFANQNIEKVGQNMKYDILVLEKYGVSIAGNFFDTMLAHYLLQPDMRHNLDILAETYLKYKNITTEEIIGAKGKNQLTMRDIAVEKVMEYACEDADVTFRLKQILAKELNEQQIEPLFFNVEMPLVRVLTDMEKVGLALDCNALKTISLELTQQIIEIEDSIFALANERFNIASPKQVGDILFGRMAIDPTVKKGKSGQYPTGEEVLQKLVNKHPIVEKILDYRGLKKLLNTYVDTLPQQINSETGRVHTSFNQAVAATGRLSSNNPNLQNIPVRDQAGREIRKAFITEPNALFVSADYSQVELRLMAHLSQDANMCEAFAQKEDIHATTASKIYKVAITDVTSDMRRKAKTANFGIIYGISAFGLAERLSIPRSEAKELIDNYFATFPGVKQYMDKSIKIAREKGYVETILGRKRYLADINSNNAMVRGMAERNAINAPIQGSAADIIKLAMINIHRTMAEKQLQSRMILQVHDELNFEVIAHELDIMKEVIRNGMEQAIQLSIPLTVDIGVGQNWLEAH